MADRVRSHVLPATESQPENPANVAPEPGDAVNATLAPLAKTALQVAPQLMPAGTEVTVPAPDGVIDTATAFEKIAVTVRAENDWTLQFEPVALSHPDQ